MADYNFVEYTPVIRESAFKMDPFKYTDISFNTPIISTPKQETKTEETPKSNWYDKFEMLKENKPQQEVVTSTPSQKFSGNKRDFINMAMKTYQGLGLTSDQAKVMAAQDSLESGYGKHVSGTHNYGGIKETRKGQGTSRMTREVINGKSVNMNQSFRNFNSYEDYAKYKINMLNNKRYHAFDGGDIVNNIVKGGYATDPNYGNVLRSIINQI